jgi:hypothetical protein
MIRKGLLIAEVLLEVSYFGMLTIRVVQAVF